MNPYEASGSQPPSAIALCLSSHKSWLSSGSIEGFGWLFTNPDVFCAQELWANARLCATDIARDICATRADLGAQPRGSNGSWLSLLSQRGALDHFDPLDPQSPRLLLIHLTLLSSDGELQEKHAFRVARNKLAVGLAALFERGDAYTRIEPYQQNDNQTGRFLAQTHADRALELFELGEQTRSKTIELAPSRIARL